MEDFMMKLRDIELVISYPLFPTATAMDVIYWIALLDKVF